VANLTRTNMLSNQRLDKPDFDNIENFVIEDFNALMKFFFTGDPKILGGFRIFQDSTTLVDNPTASPVFIKLEDSTLIHTDSSETPFMYVGAESLAAAQVDLIENATNYIEMELGITTSAPDTRAFWEQQANGTDGAEFTQIVDTAQDLTASFTVNQIGFSGGTKVPIAIIEMTGAVITSNKDRRNMFFRLAEGQPEDKTHNFPWTNSQNEPNADRILDPNAYIGADKTIATFKEWMDAVMTEFKRLKNSAYWFSNGSTLIADVNMVDVFLDAASSIITGSGLFQHSNSTPGLITWTSAMFLRSGIGDITYTIPSNNFTVLDKQVAYINLVRNEKQTADFTFTNGSNTITAPVGAFANFVVGDWIKAETQTHAVWRQIASFTPASPALATSVTLDANYSGITTIEKASLSQGTYTVQVDDPIDVPASGNTFWLAKRDDNFLTTSTIESAANNGITRVSDDVTIITIANHGLVLGQSITISGASNPDINGTFEVSEIISPTSFKFHNPGDDISGGVAGSGTVSVKAKVYLRASGELEQGETRQIDDNTTSNITRALGMNDESSLALDYEIFPNALSPFDYTATDSAARVISQICGNVNAIFTILDQPSYDESTTIAAPITSGTNILIPVNSRLGGSPQQFYTVSKGTLELFLNGQYLELDGVNGWTEVGAALTDSDTIQIQQNLVVGDVLTFRLDATGGPGTGSGGGGAPDDDFITLPTEGTADNADFVLIFDVSVNEYRRQLRSAFLAGLGNLVQVNTFSVDHLADVNTDDIIKMDVSVANRVVTLPTAASSTGKLFRIKKIDPTSNSMTIQADGAETIDGTNTISTTTQFESFTLVSDGTEWSLH